MMFPLYSAGMLAVESNWVVGLRWMKLARGGSDAQNEALLMLDEKIEASFEACMTLIQGGTMFGVIDRYREHVAANTRRLATVS
jgi:hypothetical protein